MDVRARALALECVRALAPRVVGLAWPCYELIGGVRTGEEQGTS